MMAFNEQYYRTLTFLAGFGASGALGCESVMEEETHLPDLSPNPEITAGYGSIFHRDTDGRREMLVTEE